MRCWPGPRRKCAGLEAAASILPARCCMSTVGAPGWKVRHPYRCPTAWARGGRAGLEATASISLPRNCKGTGWAGLEGAASIALPRYCASTGWACRAGGHGINIAAALLRGHGVGVPGWKPRPPCRCRATAQARGGRAGLEAAASIYRPRNCTSTGWACRAGSRGLHVAGALLHGHGVGVSGWKPRPPYRRRATGRARGGRADTICTRFRSTLAGNVWLGHHCRFGRVGVDGA